MSKATRTAAAMPKVELEPCPEAAKAALAAMFQLYVHDFSGQWAGTARG